MTTSYEWLQGCDQKTLQEFLADRNRQVLSRGLGKLGKEFVSWSMPPHLNCPGESGTCSKVCYGDTGRFNFESSKETLRINHWIARRGDFLELVASDLARRRTRKVNVTKVVRIHGIGDFFSQAYTQSWMNVVRFGAPHGFRFLAYTRSWRVAELRDQLNEMASHQAVSLWFSVDSSSGWPDVIPDGVRLAYLQNEHDDTPSRPVDLVFRTKKLRRVVARRVGGSLVCPPENGISSTEENPITCTKCGMCASAIGSVKDPRRMHGQEVKGTGKPRMLISLLG